MSLSCLLAEKEQLSSHLAAVRAAQDEIQEALETPGADAAAWTFRESLPQYVSLCGSCHSSVVLQSLHEIDVVTFFEDDAGKHRGFTDVARISFGSSDEDDPSLTPRERAARRMLRCRLALAAFLERVLRNRLKTVCRNISLILRQRTAHDQRQSMFAREILWFLEHGCHPPAEAALQFNGLFSSGIALTY